MHVELVSNKEGVRSKSFQLEDTERIVLGRGQDADVQILDSGLSREHCAIERRGPEVVLKDTESRNGTWLNGLRVTESPLRSGDIVRIGGVEFEFRCQAPAASMEPTRPIDMLPAGVGREFKKRLDLDDTDLLRPAPHAETVEHLRRVQRDLATIYKIGNLINAEKDLRRLYDRILDAIFEVISPDRGFLLLATDERRPLRVVSTRPRFLQRNPRATFSTTVTQECYTKRVSVMRVDALNDEQYGQAQSVIDQKIHSVMCVPVESLETAFGCLYVDRITNPRAFSRHDLELLAAVGKQAGIALERTRLLGHVRRMLYSTVRALVASIEAKDEDTKGHSERVTAYSLKLARSMQVTESELQTLELASLLHDVGKIGVDENILRKPGPLTPEEREIICQHPGTGSDIVRQVEAADVIADIVRHHHERWDGEGYPDRIAGSDIPFLARILTVADSFDAMRSKRPYRDRLSMEQVVGQVREGASAQFDPRIAAVLLRELEEGRFESEVA